ncbi:glycosyltransferase family 4 protein [Spongorhabdus nitratireducens]
MTSNKKLRVLQLQNNFSANPSDLAEQIVLGLPVSQFEVTSAFLKRKPGPDELPSAASNSVYFEFKSSQLKGFQRYLVLFKLYKFCKQQQFDVVICHRFKPTHLMLLLSRFLKVQRFISVTHGIGDYDRSYRQRAVTKYMDDKWRFVGVSQSVRNDLITHCKGLNEHNALAINNAIDIQRAQRVQLFRAEARELLGIDRNRFVFGTIGRLVEVKGQKYLIDAVSFLKDKYPSVQVVIIGGGRLEKSLQHQIDEAGLAAHVKLTGWRDDALQYVKAFDVFALPSLSEGMPISLLEAMSGGLPTLGSDIPSIRPVIESVGQLAEVKSAQALANAMEYYLQLTAEQLKTSGDRHFKYLCDHHSIEEYRSNYRRLIEFSSI